MTTYPRTGRRLLPVTAALFACAVACSPADGGGSSSASCAHLVTYENRTYLGTGDGDFTVGGRLGTATVPECDDTPNDPGDSVPRGETPAYAVEGMDPAVAIAVGDTPAEATLMKVR
ncbi:DUF6281 family protein [Streptomyces sp. ALI-76-A]|jgi:hypothetical protein|uniref:DUF6281 family protein n=1 Tax=Streptomyces sp. ALI-76-A TaxID=3025736 RepID=UPI00256F05DF|nr:DUF6281 family protein [Streptomyces sp. ALI-76-A]MDL5203456.1 DUF6281 family protein [Streptomyces sp. ALI-76-A]